MVSDKTTKDELYSFWNTYQEYFDHARSLNLEMTEERRELIEKIAPGSCVLDVACGSGENARHFGGRSRYYGIDISRLALGMAKEYQDQVVALVQGDATALPFADGSFDVVLSTYALEHFFEPRKALREMYRTCRPGGRILIIAANCDLPFRLPKSMASKVDKRLWRIRHSSIRLARQFLSLLHPDYLPFETIQDPDVLRDEYVSDSDIVYLVWSREVMIYLRRLGCKISHIHSSPYNPDQSWKGLIKRVSTRIPIWRYAGVNIFLVAEKPRETTLGSPASRSC